MDQTPTDEDIIAAADRCAARSTDGTITSVDVYWEIADRSWRGYRGAHRERQIPLRRIATVLRTNGFIKEQYHSRGHSRFKRP